MLSRKLIRVWGTRLRIAALLSDEGGVSALEFAMIGPVLFFALLAVVDVGVGVQDRMNVDSVLRAGAQIAMSDPGIDKVRTVLQAAATSNYSLTKDQAATTGKGLINLSVNRYCACPDNVLLPVLCTKTCSGKIHVYYTLAAARTYSSMILPDFNFNPTIRVQAR